MKGIEQPCHEVSRHGSSSPFRFALAYMSPTTHHQHKCTVVYTSMQIDGNLGHLKSFYAQAVDMQSIDFNKLKLMRPSTIQMHMNHLHWPMVLSLVF